MIFLQPHNHQLLEVALPFLNYAILVSVYVASSVLIRYNISDQLQFTYFFKLIAQCCSCKFGPWLRASVLSLPNNI